MSPSRWQHLDLDRPKPSAGAKTPPAAPTDGIAEAAAAAAPAGDGAAGARNRAVGAASPALEAARAYFLLRQDAACVEALQAALAADPSLPGASRLLGLALGRLGDLEGAIAALERAVREEADDPELRASLLSAELGAGRLPEPPPEPPGSPAELAGAAAWLGGQRLLREGAYAQAARRFAEAGRWLCAGAVDQLAERATACYIGEAISHLLAGETRAAQQLYRRLQARSALTPAGVAFARQLYQVAEAVRELDPAEREHLLRPLAEPVLRVRLRVFFRAPGDPVRLRWEGWP